MKYIINGLSLVQPKKSGIHRNTEEIIKALDFKDINHEFAIALPQNTSLSFELLNIKIINYGVNPYKFKNKILFHVFKYAWLNLFFKKICKNKISIDTLLLFPKFGCDIIYIYDCIPELFPEYYITRKLKRNRKATLKKQYKAIKKSKLILTDSYSAKDDIVSIYKIDSKRIKVVPCAWQHFAKIEEDDSILKKYNIVEKKYCFSLGSQFIHKNIKWILKAAEQNPHLTFVVSGNKILYDSNNINSNVIFTGYISDAEIKSLMRHCLVFIQPSIYEGFGIPPLEAMSVGAECIVSNSSSLPEVYGKSVWYIDPLKYDNISIESIMNQEKENIQVILNKYDWDKSADLFLTYIKELKCNID